ncbi:MAG: NADH-quinone oxidoreductase subunit C [Planctomycetes bacterium]|nr:NADH-quinone oxidoreductase subunit C [Planctomycetota bacterium]
MARESFDAIDYAENGIDEGLLKAKLAAFNVTLKRDAKQMVVVAPREHYFECVKTLRDDPELAFDYFTDLTAADLSELPDFEPERRFQVVLVIYSLKSKQRIRVKVLVGEEDCKVASVSELFAGANWTEREAYEMFGIHFEGHPNLKRLLTPEYMQYFPLRKDYPMQGRGERDNFPQYEEIQ